MFTVRILDVCTKVLSETGLHKPGHRIEWVIKTSCFKITWNHDMDALEITNTCSQSHGRLSRIWINTVLADSTREYSLIPPGPYSLIFAPCDSSHFFSSYTMLCWWWFCSNCVWIWYLCKLPSQIWELTGKSISIFPLVLVLSWFFFYIMLLIFWALCILSCCNYSFEAC